MSVGQTVGKWVGSAGGLGFLPLAPGTWGSALAAGVYLLVHSATGSVLPITALLFFGTLLLGLAVYPHAELAMGAKDARPFVLDEVAGFWLTVLLFRWRGPLATTSAAFVAFRFFDAVKPWPIGLLEQLPGRWGVMADDLAAAAISAGVLWLLLHAGADKLL